MTSGKKLLALLGTLTVATASAQAPLQVGSKRFTESYILGEIIAQTAQGPGATAAVHQRGMGNTAILLNALESRSIDVYPEYTGTIAREILKLPDVPPLAELNTRLAPRGLAVAVPLGFDNSYALAVRSSDARAKGPRPHFGPQAAPRVATRAVAGVSRPRRRLAQSGSAPTDCASRRPRASTTGSPMRQSPAARST